MHYRNGREAKNGDKIVQIGYGGVLTTGVLVDAVAGNDYCNGTLAPLAPSGSQGACLADCFHLDDVLAMIGGAERPKGK